MSKDLADNKDNVDFAKAASQLAEAAARLKTIQKLRKKIQHRLKDLLN